MKALPTNVSTARAEDFAPAIDLIRTLPAVERPIEFMNLMHAVENKTRPQLPGCQAALTSLIDAFKIISDSEKGKIFMEAYLTHLQSPPPLQATYGLGTATLQGLYFHLPADKQQAVVILFGSKP